MSHEDDLTTRRAIEIVMARVPMSRSSRDTLYLARSHVIKGDYKTTPKTNIEAIRAQLIGLLAELSGLDEKFTKQQLLTRIREARDMVRSLTDGR